MEGRVAIITGAGQGIGRAFAMRLASEGASIVVADNNFQTGAAVAGGIEARGGRALFLETELTDSASVDDMAARTRGAFGRIDILINNARWSELRETAIEDITDEDWEQALRVNVTGAFRCARAVVPAMREGGWGRIVNMSSATALRPPRRRYVHYITTKAALIGMTRALASELGADGITVNAILPGGVRTEVDRPGRDDYAARAAASQIIPRVETPDDLAGMAAYLCSDEAGFVTGQCLVVDGGYSIA